jgi:branched-chain amino acid transport system permease protein
MSNSRARSVAVAASIVAILLPLALQSNRFAAFIFGIVLIQLVWSCGMNLLYGYVGLMPLMYAGIAGLASYAMIHLTRVEGWSFWLAMPVASIAAAAVGVLLGLPSLRLHGFYFTLSSLVIQTGMTLAFTFFPKYTNGDTGIGQISPPSIGGTVLSGTSLETVLALFAVGSIWLLAVIVGRPLGKRLVAVREDELLAEAVGIDVVKTKVLAFFLASLYAGVGGCLYSVYVGFVSPRAFDILVSLSIWLLVAFGGRGSISGPIVGTIILAPLPYLLQDFSGGKDILMGALIIAVVLWLPGGIVKGFVARSRARKTARATQAAQYPDRRPHEAGGSP